MKAYQFDVKAYQFDMKAYQLHIKKYHNLVTTLICAHINLDEKYQIDMFENINVICSKI